MLRDVFFIINESFHGCVMYCYDFLPEPWGSKPTFVALIEYVIWELLLGLDSD